MQVQVLEITLSEYNARVEANPESVFFRYTDGQDAVISYNRKLASPRYNNDELFFIKVEGAGWSVQTTGCNA